LIALILDDAGIGGGLVVRADGQRLAADADKTCAFNRADGDARAGQFGNVEKARRRQDMGRGATVRRG
jgi:hypothetical protein